MTAAALTGLGLALAVLALLTPRPRATGVARSLELIAQAPRPLAVPDVVPLAEQDARRRIGRPLVRALGRLGRRITPVGTAQRWRHRLDLAGNTGAWTTESLLAGKAAAVISLGGLGALAYLADPSGRRLLFLLALSAAGYWLPDVLLYNAGTKRQDRIRAHLPDAVDMLVVCIEAGLGFDAGLSQVARNTTGPLAQELTRVLQEIQLGRSRAEAFTDLGARSSVGELRTLVTAVVQADRLGVPVAAVLREQASEMRLRRRQRAEEAAQKVPVKIVFPVLLCIFPAFFVVVIGPGAIRIAETFLRR
jgi:tight adherence protein C